MTSRSLPDGSFQRGLKNRHIQLIALGGAIVMCSFGGLEMLGFSAAEA
jgi:L-asparagine transporter-like permease